MPTVTVNGVSLFYEFHGPDTAPVVVLNNGILMTAAASWALQLPALTRHYRVLVYDCRGQGESEHPAEPYTMAQHAEDLRGLLDALGLDRVHVAGISYGGEVAQTFALAHPQRVRSLFLAATVSEVGPALRVAIQGWIDAARSPDPDALFTATLPWNFSAGFLGVHGPWLEQSRPRYRDLDRPAVVRLCESFLQVALTARLPAIAAPTCIVAAERDILKGVGYARILHGAIRDSELHVIPDAGHAVCLEKPEEFNTVLLGFLAKQS